MKMSQVIPGPAVWLRDVAGIQQPITGTTGANNATKAAANTFSLGSAIAAAKPTRLLTTSVQGVFAAQPGQQTSPPRPLTIVDFVAARPFPAANILTVRATARGLKLHALSQYSNEFFTQAGNRFGLLPVLPQLAVRMWLEGYRGQALRRAVNKLYRKEYGNPYLPAYSMVSISNAVFNALCILEGCKVNMRSWNDSARLFRRYQFITTSKALPPPTFALMIGQLSPYLQPYVLADGMEKATITPNPKINKVERMSNIERLQLTDLGNRLELLINNLVSNSTQRMYTGAGYYARPSQLLVDILNVYYCGIIKAIAEGSSARTIADRLEAMYTTVSTQWPTCRMRYRVKFGIRMLLRRMGHYIHKPTVGTQPKPARLRRYRHYRPSTATF